MLAWPEVLGDRPIRGEKPLRVPCGLEPLHAPLPLAGGLVRVLGAVIQVSMLAVLHPRQYLALRGAIAFELIGDEPPWDILTPFEELMEELLGRFFVPPSLHQDIEDGTVLIHGSPQIVTLFSNRDKHLIQVPFVARPRAPTPELIGEMLAEFAAPLADGFVGDDDATDEQEFFHITMAERKTEIQPDGVTDDLPWEPMLFVGIRRGWGRHGSSTEWID
jgi:hypothetical protein